jgi:N-acetylglucosaminyldiphosphoundecaprenol N-acetyl-beta-D-mannosaminyltransferase
MLTKKLFNVNYTITDYDVASDLIITKGLNRESYGVSALAVHGLIESVRRRSFSKQLEKIDMIVPDGQPVRWALNHFFKAGLRDRVAGPILTQHVLRKAHKNSMSIFLYGSTFSTLQKMQEFIKKKYPHIIISGVHIDRFRDATTEEDIEDIIKINNCNPHLVLVGRGCPRQENWVAEHIGKVNAPMMAIGAAFDFMAGNIKHAPLWMQNMGLEWLYRLIQDPKKLWKRYLITNSYFIFLIILCKIGVRKFQA